MTAFEVLSLEDQARLEAASSWWIRLSENPSLELSPGFLEWAADPANTRALTAVKQSMIALDDFGATPQILDMRRAALNSLRNAGVRRWLPRRTLLRASAAACLLAILGGAGWYAYTQSPNTYATDVGERRIVDLSDGSRMLLDSDSQVEVRYSRATREITLTQGRARFDVVHDVARPFTVTAGAETVVAVGTSFNVERVGSKVLVTLIQGRVVVKNDPDKMPPRTMTSAAAKPTVSLKAGEQLVVTQDVKRAVVTQANLDAATAWEDGHLVFRGETLGEAVERVNRYTEHPIIVEQSAASIVISGVFNAGDTGAFVSGVTSYFPVEATTDADNRIVLQRKS